jgi:NRAMP (natural resistance-associated macrophage protein)-like metal ion transporter
VKAWRGAGPGLVVTAAFIGPGTVTTATLAGAGYGTALLWTLLFATVATIVLQEMSARLGLTTGTGLGQALRSVGGAPWIGVALAGAATVAVVSGAAAYEAGNLTGASLGLESVTGIPLTTWVAIGSLVAAALLWTGRYRIVERVLAVCVAVMGVVFVATAAMVAPHLGELATGLFAFRLPKGADLTALALVGTTIVPYNLFLHAAAVRERWSGPGPVSFGHGRPAATTPGTLGWSRVRYGLCGCWSLVSNHRATSSGVHHTRRPGEGP